VFAIIKDNLKPHLALKNPSQFIQYLYYLRTWSATHQS